MIRRAVQAARSLADPLRLPRAAVAEAWRDRRGRLGDDPGIERVVTEGIAWLSRAQDRSATQDGGVARHFSLIDGWGPSYPETTGYIVPTMLAHAARRGDGATRASARRMLDWLVALQFPEGGFPGGTVGATPVVPVTFNTGQILFGLADGVRVFGDAYRPAMRAAADWLATTQDDDGCWRRHPTPFAERGEKVYETHVAWALLEAARVAPHAGYDAVALRNVRWALTHQSPIGWFASCCLSDSSQPLTHTIGYALRGIVEAYRFSRVGALLDACRRTADGVLTAMRPDGSLPGRLDARWNATVSWACLTGISQIAHSFLLLHIETGDARYRDAAIAMNRFVRRTIRTDGPDDTRGAVKGAYPVSGDYGRFEYLNWACKFTIDANVLEAEVRGGRA